jgi:ribonucleoside-diphosphate reductase alpha chain
LIKIEGILEQKENGDKLSSIEVHDIVCVIADAVLAGGIRRSALISFFDADDHEMISCKSGSWWETHPYRGRANNSAVLMRSKITESFFMNLWEKIQMSGSGEPGIMLTNDKDVLGNPCNEVALRSNQMCNLVEINASDIVDQEDYNNRVRSAAFIATLQASYTDFHYLRDIWKRTTEKEALIGVSMTGVASNKIFELNIKEAAEIVKNENERVAELIKINKAARTTTCKPAGTTSLIFGTSSGIHAWHDKFYIRRIRVGKNEPIYAYLKQNHPALIEDEYFRPHDTAVICVPQKAPDNSTLRNEETSLELLERIKQVHADWIKPGHRKGANTNNVSATISVKPDEWDVVGQWMWENRDSYTGLSVLPFSDHTYIQAPFETCTEEEYNRLFQSLQSVDLSQIFESEDETDLQGELACAGAGCIVV